MALLDYDEKQAPCSLQFRGRTVRADPAVLGMLGYGQADNDNHAQPHPLASELDCLIGILPMYRLRNATDRSFTLGIGADRVLIAAGHIDERTYLKRLAQHCGMAVETFSGLTRADVLLDEAHVGHAARHGVVPVRAGTGLKLVIAPQMLGARRLVERTTRDPALSSLLRLATASDMQDFLLHRIGDTLVKDAAWGLSKRSAVLSAAPIQPSLSKRSRDKPLIASTGLAVLATLLPSFAMWFWSQVLAMMFIAAVSLRLGASFLPRRVNPPCARLSDAELPIYTIIVALYRMERSVPQLLRALDALDYPREKLDIILAVEVDDVATRLAIRRFGAMPHLRVVVAPDVGPRTKPKALNCSLSFARGSVIAVFDAEDQPHPGQLRAALDALRSGGEDVACAQASLCIHNVADSVFTRMFAAEYAGQFDVVLPGLADMKLPLPLGGTSNHFRADALRAVGGWDAWNVTEDADLGVRLARFGYRAVTFASTTQEEAPISFVPWLKQRSRWMKGWMQTWSVHAREPLRFWRDAGWRGFVTLNFVIGANILGALVYPFFLMTIALEATMGSGAIIDGLLTPLHGAAIVGGLSSSVAIGLCGLARRGRLRDGWILLLTPIYWGCLSLATWRALFQLLRDPYHWEKTEHGLTVQRERRLVRQRTFFKSAAASSGVRFRLNGAMNFPLRSIR